MKNTDEFKYVIWCPSEKDVIQQAADHFKLGNPYEAYSILQDYLIRRDDQRMVDQALDCYRNYLKEQSRKESDRD